MLIVSFLFPTCTFFRSRAKKFLSPLSQSAKSELSARYIIMEFSLFIFGQAELLAPHELADFPDATRHGFSAFRVRLPSSA